jgi:hypothetical protein
MPFNLRNIFAGPSRPAEHPDYERHHHDLLENSHQSLIPIPLKRRGSREPLSPVRQLCFSKDANLYQLSAPTSSKGGKCITSPAFQTSNPKSQGPISRGATVVDYDDHSDSSSLLSEGVFVQDANHIPAVHRQFSRDHLHYSNHQNNHHYEDRDAVRPGTYRRNSLESSTTRSSDRTSSDPEDVPPRIIPEYSRRNSEYRSEYTAGTRYANPPPETIDQSSTRSKRDRRRKRRSRSDGESAQNPIILMFENGRGGYDNMWYIYPGKSPVIFQDPNGNEITRYEAYLMKMDTMLIWPYSVGDFSDATSARTKPPIVLDRFGRYVRIHPFSFTDLIIPSQSSQ